MKKVFILLVGVFLFSTGAGAVDVSVSANPSETLWLSEDFEFATVCGESSETGYSVFINNVTRGENLAPAGEDSQLVYNRDGNEYVLASQSVKDFLNDRYGYKPGKYVFFTTCDKGNSTGIAKHSLTVESLIADIVDEPDRTYFSGQEHNLSLTLKKEGDGSPVIIGGDTSQQPTFSASIDGSNVDVSSYYNAENRQWVLNMPVPDESGTYPLTIIASHEGATTSQNREITVEDTLTFDAGLSTNMVGPGQIVDLSLAARHRGDQLALSKEDLSIRLAETEIMDKVTMKSGSSARIEMPPLEPGTYELVVELDRDGVPTATKQFTVRYPVTIAGAFTDRDNDPLSYTLEFSQDDSVKKRITGNGEYNTRITPGVYNVTTGFRDATITFTNVDVSSWDDPIRYRQYRENALSGFTLAGLYSFRTSLSYDIAKLSLRYDSGAMNNPDDMGVYRCPGWNSESLACYRSWSELSADRDEVNSRMAVESTESGAYAIGKRTALRVTYAEDKLKSSYTPDQTVDLSGRVKGPDGETVTNATITLNVDGTDINRQTRTDDSGMFDVSFAVPEDAGQYTMAVNAEKSPYRDGQASIGFNVERPSSIDIVAPESITVTANTSKNVSVYVENTGYTTIEDLAPVTENVPFLERISFVGRPLQAGESRTVPLTLSVPADAPTKTHKAELVFRYAGQESAAVFGITVNELVEQESTENTDSSTTSGMVTGNLPSLSAITNPVSNIEFPFQDIVLFIIALQVGVVGLVFAKGRMQSGGRTQRDHILRAVSDIKTEVGQSVMHQDEGAQNRYSFGRRKDGVERENVLRAMRHIKDQLASER